MKIYLVKYKINDIISQTEIKCAGYYEMNGVITFNIQCNNIFSINKEYLIYIIDCDNIDDYISQEELDNLKLIKSILIELSENDISIHAAILKIEAKGCSIMTKK